MDQTLALNSVSKNQSLSRCVSACPFMMSDFLPVASFSSTVWRILHLWGSCRSLAAHTEVSLLVCVVCQRNVVTNGSQTLVFDIHTTLLCEDT